MFARHIPDDTFPRWRWAWQMLALFLSLAVILVALWQGSAWEAHRRLSAEIESLRAAGQPVTIADRAAALGATIAADDREITTAYVNGISPIDPFLPGVLSSLRHQRVVERRTAEHMITATAELRRRVRDAIDAGSLYWATRRGGVPVHAEGILALQIIAIDLACCTDDIAGAIREWQLTERILGDARRGPSSLLAHLVSIRWRSTLNDRLARLAAQAIPGEDPAHDAFFSEQMARLLDERIVRDQWRDMLIGERAAFLEGLGAPGLVGTGIATPPTWVPSVISILARTAARDYLAHSVRMLALSDSPSYETAAAAAPVFPAVENNAERAAHSFSAMVIPSFSPYWIFGPLAENQCTAIAIAAARYRHVQGFYPVTVEDLVPDYLSAAPIDPFAPSACTYSFVETGDALEIRGTIVEEHRRTRDEFDRLWISLPKAPLAECIEDDE